jgi:hypothetical protein
VPAIRCLELIRDRLSPLTVSDKGDYQTHVSRTDFRPRYPNAYLGSCIALRAFSAASSSRRISVAIC